MDRYDNLDLDLECDGGGGGGGAAAKAALFGGMFKKSTKSIETSVNVQDGLSANGELSKSNDSLTDNNKEKGGVFKGMFKKTSKPGREGATQATLSVQNTELSASSDSSPDNNSSKERAGFFGGILKRSPKPGYTRRPSQDNLDDALSASNDSLTDNKNTKESGGIFTGMFKKPSKPFAAQWQSQDDLSEPAELSGSTDKLSENNNTKESGGIFTGMFKKPSKAFAARSQSQDDLSEPAELSGSIDNLSENNNTKESGGIFSGMFKKSPKPFAAQSQDDLSEPADLSGSTDKLSENSNTKEKGGIFSGVFKKPKLLSAKSPEDLSADSELSRENLSEKSSKGGVTKILKNPFQPSSQEKSSDSDGEEILDDTESQTGSKQSKFSEAMTKLNPFRSANKYEKQAVSDDEDPPASRQKPSGHKQSGIVGAMSKLNPFHSADKKDVEEAETLKDNDKRGKEKQKPVKGKMIQPERKERNETPTVVPRRPAEEELKRTSTYDKVKQRGTEEIQDKKTVPIEGKGKPADAPTVPARPTEESQSDDEGLKESLEGEEEKCTENKTTKVKKHKPHNPFLSRAAAKTPSDDEGLKEEESSSKAENKEEEGKDKVEKAKVKRPKRHNLFMPQVKARAAQKHAQDQAEGNTAENEGGRTSLFDQLEEYRVDPTESDNEQSLDGLMDWWNTVETWEDTPEVEDMTEKEEAKAFAVTAEKVQKGIRVFNKLFSEHAESLWQHVIDLNAIADGLDKFNKKTKIAQITGGSTSAIGGVATIAGLALAPVTMGTSLIVTAVGLGVATAGGLTSAGAGISNQVNNSMDRKKVEKIVEDYQEKMVDLNKCLKFIKQGIENLRRFDLLKMRKHAYNRDFPALTANFYEDGAMAGKAILISANEIMRVVQIANVAGSTAARAVQIASMATGVLTGLFVGMDIYFVAKDSKELKKGAKSEFAAKIRDVAKQLHEGLVELNGIREELQSANTENSENSEITVTSDKKDEKYDSSDEDEIDRIKKAIKTDIENREYV